MEFRDLKKQYQVLKADIDKAVETVMASGHFIGGNPVSELETQLAQYVGRKHCISCANGTDALSLVLMAWNIGPGDAVFVPDFTFFSTSEVVSFCGATPIFVDVNKETFNIDPISLKAAIEHVKKESELKPRAIIPVDLFGLPADYPALNPIAHEYNLLILSDSAQGFGGRIGEQKAGSFGDAATTSFFPAKPLGCYGDGGAIFTDDDTLAEHLRSLKVHGKGSFKYDNIRIGINSRLDTIQAAILQIKLRALIDYELAEVNRAAKTYRKYLNEFVLCPQIPEGYYSSYAQFTIILDSKEEREYVQKTLQDQGIPTNIYYPIPLHQQKVYAKLPKPNPLPSTTISLCDTVLSLPMHPYLEDTEIEKIALALIDARKTYQSL